MEKSELIKKITDRQELKRLKEEAEAALKAADMELQEYMTENNLDDFTVGAFHVTWKYSKPREGVDVDALKADGLYPKYVKLQKPARPFIVK